MSDLRVTFPEPCREKWEAMSPSGCNRHCATCDTIIHDLSHLTVDEAESLLDSQSELCVRAIVSGDGAVRTATSRTSRSRRMVAILGASASLATAACQTPQVSPRYEVSGQIKYGGYSDRAQLRSETGEIYKVRIWGDRKFQFRNLRPGTYDLMFSIGCGELRSFQTIVVQADLMLEDVDLSKEDMCIIVGKLQRADEAGKG